MQKDKAKRNYIGIEGLDRELWKQVKIRTFQEDKLIHQWVNEAIKEKLERKSKVK